MPPFRGLLSTQFRIIHIKFPDLWLNQVNRIGLRLVCFQPRLVSSPCKKRCQAATPVMDKENVAALKTDLKNQSDFGADNFCMQNFYATEAALRTVSLNCNAIAIPNTK